MPITQINSGFSNIWPKDSHDSRYFSSSPRITSKHYLGILSNPLQNPIKNLDPIPASWRKIKSSAPVEEDWNYLYWWKPSLLAPTCLLLTNPHPSLTSNLFSFVATDLTQYYFLGVSQWSLWGFGDAIVEDPLLLARCFWNNTTKLNRERQRERERVFKQKNSLIK